MRRIIALIILLIPIFLAAYGIKLMRDMVFGVLQAPIPSLPLQFIFGVIFFLLGLGFIGGLVLHRDRKRNKVSGRFNKKKK